MSRHGRRRRLVLLGGPFLAAAALLLLPAGAGAATTVGSTFTPSGFQCQNNFWALQTVSPSGEYVIPSAGVLTSWSHLASATPPTNLKVEVGRNTTTPGQFLIVGNSANKSPSASVMNTYTDISIPVKVGDILGLHSDGGNKDCGVLATGYTVNYLGTDPAPGGTVDPPTFTSGLRLDISATLEADCDADGLGDETEDGDTSSCNPPPTTTTPPPATTATPKKKCKKKKHRSAGAVVAKKCKKKRR
jgi:hypothetical protein